MRVEAGITVNTTRIEHMLVYFLFHSAMLIERWEIESHSRCNTILKSIVLLTEVHVDKKQISFLT